jgi:aspartate carbamoyltransferase catalytic subunit
MLGLAGGSAAAPQRAAAASSSTISRRRRVGVVVVAGRRRRCRPVAASTTATTTTPQTTTETLPPYAGEGDKKWHRLPVKHVIEAQQFGREALDVVFATACEMEQLVAAQRKAPLGSPGPADGRLLSGRVMATLFYEPSTRTRLSFEAAMARLGGSVLSTESAGEYSSAAKGETLEDTIRTVEGYADAAVLRHFAEGSARRAASASSIPVINAGDGPGQHPTQALLDVYSILKELRGEAALLRGGGAGGGGHGNGDGGVTGGGDKSLLAGAKIAMVGDLAHGRTARSLAYLLGSQYPGVEITFVAPPVVRMGDDIKSFLSRKGCSWQERDDLSEVAAQADVVYMTRIQKERFRSEEDYAKAKGKYVLDKGVMGRMRRDAVVLHPLPRVDEISAECDSDPRAAYFRQAQNGLFVRMALLKLAMQ